MTERALRMTSDSEADAAYIYVTDPIGPGESASTSVLDHRFDAASVPLDFDADNRLLGIELLGA